MDWKIGQQLVLHGRTLEGVEGGHLGNGVVKIFVQIQDPVIEGGSPTVDFCTVAKKGATKGMPENLMPHGDLPKVHAGAMKVLPGHTTCFC